MKLSRKIFYIITVLLIAGLLFTPFYSLGYLALIALSTRFIGFSKMLTSSIVSRFIVGLLFLAAAIMFVGFIAWGLKAPVHPLLVASGYSLLIAILYYTKHSEHTETRPTFINKGDVVSISLSLIAPLIMLLSFQAPQPSMAAVYQFLNNGWDNSSHLLMLESASMENGYLYGPFSELNEKTVSKFNSYPQAWHLSTANIANGFGVKPFFDPANQVHVLKTYSVAVFVWYLVTVFLFTRLTWELALSTKKRLSRTGVGLFFLVSIAIQSALFWHPLTIGHINYVACITYLILAAAIIIDRRSGNRNDQYIAALVAGTAAGLSWFLPLPAIAAMIALGFWDRLKYPFWHVKNYTSAPWYIYAASAVAIGLALIQVAVFVLYSDVSGGEQLNVGRISEEGYLFLAIITVAALGYWITAKTSINNSKDKVVAIIAPIALLTALIYVYQLTTAGTTSYYFGKSAGLVLVMAGLWFVPFFIATMGYLHSRKLSSISTLLVGASMLSLLFIGTGQPMSGLYFLFQRNANTSYPVAQEVIKYLNNENPETTKLVILRDKLVSEDYNGNLASKTPHLPMTCAYSIVNKESSLSLELKLAKLDSCAKEIYPTNILVITSNNTEASVKALKKDNIRTINAP